MQSWLLEAVDVARGDYADRVVRRLLVGRHATNAGVARLEPVVLIVVALQLLIDVAKRDLRALVEVVGSRQFQGKYVALDGRQAAARQYGGRRAGRVVRNLGRISGLVERVR